MSFSLRIRCPLIATVAICCLILASCDKNAEIVWMGFSADGRFAAYARQDGTLTLVDVESRKECANLECVAAGGFAWSPEGHRLSFCLHGRTGWDLAVLDAAGTVTQLTHDQWRDFQPAWSPDGRGIYHVSSRGGGYHGDYDIRFLDLESGQNQAVISGPQDQVQPRVSPDGRWLAAVSYKDGNPIIVVYAIKSVRAKQISLPLQHRGADLSLLGWADESRGLLAQIRSGEQYYLAICETDTEEWRTLENGRQPFESLCTNGAGDVFYISNGKAYKQNPSSRWGQRSRISARGLPLTRVAVRTGDGAVGVVAAGTLPGLAGASGRKVEPLLASPKSYLAWGDLELRHGLKRSGLKHYRSAFETWPTSDGEKGEQRRLHSQIDRAALLCQSGYTRECSAYLKAAQKEADAAASVQAWDQINAVFAFAMFAGKGDIAASGEYLSRIPSERMDSLFDGKAALLNSLIDHEQADVQRAARRGINKLWRGSTRDGLHEFLRLLEANPADSLVQDFCLQAIQDRFVLADGDVSTTRGHEKSSDDSVDEMTIRFFEVAGNSLEMSREWFDQLASAYLHLRDANGLGKLVLNHGLSMLETNELLEAYRYFCRVGPDLKQPAPVDDETLAVVLFDPPILREIQKRVKNPGDWADLNLARAHWALVDGEYDELKLVLSAIESGLAKNGKQRLFANQGNREVLYELLQAGLAEREGAWAEAVRHYRAASDVIESSLKRETEASERARLQAILTETEFRADLFQRGPSARGEIDDYLTVERGMGDGLITFTSDPTSLANGVHNLFSMMPRTGTTWVGDLVYLKAGRGYRLLGRWGEAAFCLRIAGGSAEAFVAKRANAELSDLFREMGDPGLASWYERRARR